MCFSWFFLVSLVSPEKPARVALSPSCFTPPDEHEVL